MTTYALDFESFYDKECSIKTLGPNGYFSHPRFDAYLVTVVGDDGFRYAGNPKDLDWSLFDGHRIISHNAGFDMSLYIFGISAGWWPSCDYAEWQCTADMCAFLGLPRSLKGAAQAVLGVELSKTTRDNMSGKVWDTMTPEFKAEVIEYAIKDAVYCLQLWQELSTKWPQHERDISCMNRKIMQRGLPIDQPLLKHNLETIRTELFNAEQLIPWTGEYTPLSRKAFNNQCRKEGIPIPKSLAQDDEDADKWFAEFQKHCPWARAVQNYRRINSFLCKLEAFDAGTMSDGRYYGGLMYAGANPTLRFSGSGGNLNLQNLPRDEMFGVNFRPMIRPKPGNKLLVADLAQIEVRTLLWWAKDRDTLDMIRTHDDIYEVIAIMLGLHDPANGPLSANRPLRQRVKAMALGCQFGLSGDGFASYSGMPVSEAHEAVNTYRTKMRKVVQFWNSLQTDIEMASALGQEFTLDLPSGRSMNYGVPRKMKTRMSNGQERFGYVGKIVRNGQLRDFKLWKGLAAENAAQGLARDIFSDMMLRVEAAGIPLILHVHDEMVAEVPEADAEEALATMLKIMSTPPAWIPEIPVAAEGHILDAYTK